MTATCGRASRFVLGALPLFFCSLYPQPLDVTTLNQQGSAFIQEGKPAEALAAFRKAAGLAPEDPAIQYNIGLALFQLGRYQEALEPLDRALANEAAIKQVRYLRGVVRFQLKDYQACAAELELVRSDPRFAEQSLYMLEESYRHAGDAQAAQNAFLELERRYPGSAFLHKLMGMAYEARDYPDKALEEFHAALKSQPKMADVAFGIGYIYFTRQDYSEARKWMKRELELQPCYARAHHYLAEADAAEERWAEAEVRYRKALECDPNLADSYLGLGTVQERQDNLQAAIASYRQGVRLAPGNSTAHLKLGTALRRAGEADEARKELAIARRLYQEKQKQDARQRHRR